MATSPKPPAFTTKQHKIGQLDITLKEGNALHERADVLVNAASVHGLGVDSWGTLAGQFRILADSDTTGTDGSVLRADWTRRGGNFPVGTADLVTDDNENVHKFSSTDPNSSRQPYYLMHAGSPIASGTGLLDSTKKLTENGLTEEDLLVNAYFDILEKMKDHNIKNAGTDYIIRSAAIVPLGIGAYNVNPEQSAFCAAKAIARFNKLNSKNPNAAFQITIPLYSGSAKNVTFGTALNEYLKKIKQGEKLDKFVPTPAPTVPSGPVSKKSAPPLKKPSVNDLQKKALSSVQQGLLNQSATPKSLPGKSATPLTPLKRTGPVQTLSSTVPSAPVLRADPDTSVMSTPATLNSILQKIQQSVAQLPSSSQSQWTISTSSDKPVITISLPNQTQPAITIKQTPKGAEFEFAKMPPMTPDSAKLSLAAADNPVEISSSNLHDLITLTTAAAEINKENAKNKVPLIDVRLDAETINFLEKQDVSKHPNLKTVFDRAKSMQEQENDSFHP